MPKQSSLPGARTTLHTKRLPFVYNLPFYADRPHIKCIMTLIINKTFSSAFTMCAQVWDAYVWLTQIVPYIAAVWGILKAYRAFHLLVQANPAQPSHRPGKTLPVVCQRSLPAFHPDVDPAILGLPPVQAAIRWSLARLFAPIADALVSVLSNATKMVSLVKQACQTSTINNFVAPLGTRLNRVTQISNTLTPHATAYRATFHYFCPISFLFGIGIGIVTLVGVSLELVAVLGLGGLVLVATGGVGTIDDEGDVADDRSTPEMNNAGLAGTLQAQGRIQ